MEWCSVKVFSVIHYGRNRRLRAFGNRALNRLFRPKKEEVAGSWRRLHSEELHNLYASPNIIRVIKSRRMRWAGHVARMGEMRNAYDILVGKFEGKRLLEGLGADGEIILEWILWK
jgi:hypothetical protein